jgi:hypothetical protein
MPVNRFKNYSPAVPHLVRPGGLKGEVQDLRKDLDNWSIEVSNAIDAGTGGITELTGDVTTPVGTGSQTATVEGLQGNPVSAAAPNVSDVLTWSGTEWAPTAGGGGGLWSKTGTELSPATAGDTVQIEIAVGTAGLTVEDTPASLLSEVRPGVLYLTDNVKAAELNTVSASLLLKGDSGEAIPVVPTITAQDYDSSSTPLDLVVGELRVNGAAGAAGEVLTSNGPGAAPTWQAGGGGGTIGGTVAATEVAFGTAADTVGGSASFTYNSTTQDLTVGDGSPHSIRIGPYGYVSNPIIESLNSMNINIADFGGALGIQAANNDLVLIGGDDGGGQSYLQTQPNVRLETQGRLLVKPATDGADGVEVRNAANVLLVQVDTASKTTTLTGDANPVLVLVDEIAAAPFLQITPVTRELALSDPTTLTDTTLVTPTDVSINNGSQTVNLSAGQARVTDAGTGNTLTLSIPGAVATLASEDGASNPFPLNLVIEELQVNANPGNAGEVLTSNGPGAAPTWQAGGGGGAGLGSKVLLCVEGGAYATIQDAIDAAADWDVILVGPKAAGASWGPMTFSPGKRLVVSAIGSKWSTQVKVDSITFDANSGLNILLNTVFVRGLFINSSFTALAPGVNFYGSAPARLRLQECFIYNSNAATGTGVVSNNSGSGSSLYIDNCIVQSGASTGIGLDHQQGYTIIRNDSEISRYQYPLQCAAGTVEIIDSVLDGTGIANEVVRMTGGLVTCGYTTIKNTTTNATGANLVNAGAAFGMGDATFSIGTGTGYCVNGVAGSFYLYGNVTYSNTAAAAYNVKVKNTLTALAVTQAFTSSP